MTGIIKCGKQGVATPYYLFLAACNSFAANKAITPFSSPSF